MRAFVLCSCVLALTSFSSTQIIREVLKREISNVTVERIICMNENNITSSDWYSEKEIVNEEYKESEHEVRRRKNGCSLACILKKENLMEGSNFVESGFHEEIDELTTLGEPYVITSKKHQMVHKCIQETNDITEECEKTFALYVCAMKEWHKAKKHGEHPQTEDDKDTEK